MNFMRFVFMENSLYFIYKNTNRKYCVKNDVYRYL